MIIRAYRPGVDSKEYRPLRNLLVDLVVVHQKDYLETSTWAEEFRKKIDSCPEVAGPFWGDFAKVNFNHQRAKQKQSVCQE